MKRIYILVIHTRWNYNRKGGWEKYKSLTEEKTNNLAIKEDSNVNDLASKFEKKLIKVKHQSFGKCSFKKSILKPKVSSLVEARRATNSEEEKKEIDK